MKQSHNKAKLEAFFVEIAALTVNHNVENDKAVIYASKLGKALEKVDEEWWKEIPAEALEASRPYRRR